MVGGVSSFSVKEGNTSAITSADDGLGGTTDICEGNAVGKVSCGIACGMAGDEFCFTAKEGKAFCDVASMH